MKHNTNKTLSLILSVALLTMEMNDIAGLTMAAAPSANEETTSIYSEMGEDV